MRPRAGLRCDARQNSRRAEARGARQHQPPGSGRALRTPPPGGRCSCASATPHVQDHRLAGTPGNPAARAAVMHHAHPRGSTPSRNHLAPGELGDRDDGVGARGGVARLRGEAGAEFRRRILARHHEQVVKGGHRRRRRIAAAADSAVKQVGAAGTERSGESDAGARSGSPANRPREKTMRPIAEFEAYLGMEPPPDPTGFRGNTARPR
jgi:hypothetical protein